MFAKGHIRKGYVRRSQGTTYSADLSEDDQYGHRVRHAGNTSLRSPRFRNPAMRRRRQGRAHEMGPSEICTVKIE